MCIRKVGPGLFALGLEQNSMGGNRKSIENPNREQAIHSRAQLCAPGHRRLGAPSVSRRHPEGGLCDEGTQPRQRTHHHDDERNCIG